MIQPWGYKAGARICQAIHRNFPRYEFAWLREVSIPLRHPRPVSDSGSLLECVEIRSASREHKKCYSNTLSISFHMKQDFGTSNACISCMSQQNWFKPSILEKNLCFPCFLPVHLSFPYVYWKYLILSCCSSLLPSWTYSTTSGKYTRHHKSACCLVTSRSYYSGVAQV